MCKKNNERGRELVSIEDNVDTSIRQLEVYIKKDTRTADDSDQKPQKKKTKKKLGSTEQQ